tara:strand:- start:660 stop:1607 length:948 start_codon:yes stop_codon:yes gene_type:complete
LSSKPYKLSHIAKYIGASLDGDDIKISSMKSLKSASTRDISFFYSNKFKKDLLKTKAGAVITDPANAKHFKGNKLLIDNVHLAYAKVTDLFAESTYMSEKKALSSKAFISKESKISDDVYVGPGCVIEKNVEIGKGSILLPNVTILSNVSIGENCIIHSGTVIGSDGLGFAKDENDRWKKIHHLGKVMISNDVEIGSNCTIDRGVLDDTTIGDNVKLDDQVHIAHNCKIGSSTIMGANATVGGTTVIGKNCMIGGLCGIADNLVITNGVIVSPVSFISKSINKSGKYSGSAPLMQRNDWLKASAAYKKISKKIND